MRERCVTFARIYLFPRRLPQIILKENWFTALQKDRPIILRRDEEWMGRWLVHFLLNAQGNENLIHWHLHVLPAAHRRQPLHIDVFVLRHESVEVAAAQARQPVPISRRLEKERVAAQRIEVIRFVGDFSVELAVEPEHDGQSRVAQTVALSVEEFDGFRLFVGRQRFEADGGDGGAASVGLGAIPANRRDGAFEKTDMLRIVAEIEQINAGAEPLAQFGEKMAAQLRVIGHSDQYLRRRDIFEGGADDFN
ncbi:MAG: hypothetical protein JMDDDDMK_00688 [Acidobacteria bacterium]|nr:hypothetical protein [Acidobacteriota bacterium]